MWKLTINRDHVALWGRWLAMWVAFVAFGLVVGWHLKPRMDEFLVVLSLPLAVVAAYAIGCLVVLVIRSLWPIRLQSRWQRRRFGGVEPNKRIGE